MGQVVQTPEQHYYLSNMGYDYEIKYKPGKDNKAVDALWQLDSPLDSQSFLLTTITFDFLK